MTLTVGVIFMSYVICNLPATLVLLIDPSAERIAKVFYLSIHGNYSYTNTTQAHIPSYMFAWLSAVINPCVYVIFNPTYRQAFKDAYRRIKCSCRRN